MILIFSKDELLSSLDDYTAELENNNVNKDQLTDMLDDIFTEYKNNYDFQNLVDSEEFGNVYYQLRQANANKSAIVNAIKDDPNNYDQYLIHDKNGYHQVTNDDALIFINDLMIVLDDTLADNKYYY